MNGRAIKHRPANIGQLPRRTLFARNQFRAWTDLLLMNPLYDLAT